MLPPYIREFVVRSHKDVPTKEPRTPQNDPKKGRVQAVFFETSISLIHKGKKTMRRTTKTGKKMNRWSGTAMWWLWCLASGITFLAASASSEIYTLQDIHTPEVTRL